MDFQDYRNVSNIADKSVAKRTPPSGRYKTMVAAYVFAELLPEWEKLFETKNAGYGEYDGELGPMGEVVELHRKLGKLKRAFLEKADTSNWDESPREVVLDMIGHCFLLLYVLDEAGSADIPVE
jgi:hypothetical protein